MGSGSGSGSASSSTGSGNSGGSGKSGGGSFVCWVVPPRIPMGLDDERGRHSGKSYYMQGALRTERPPHLTGFAGRLSDPGTTPNKCRHSKQHRSSGRIEDWGNVGGGKMGRRRWSSGKLVNVPAAAQRGPLVKRRNRNWGCARDLVRPLSSRHKDRHRQAQLDGGGHSGKSLGWGTGPNFCPGPRRLVTEHE